MPRELFYCTFFSRLDEKYLCLSVFYASCFVGVLDSRTRFSKVWRHPDRKSNALRCSAEKLVVGVHA